MKHTPILLLTLVAASASAAVGGSGLNYDRLGIGYSTDDSRNTVALAGSAQLGDSGFIASGSYGDVSADFKGFSGTEVTYGLAYKFSVGSGDLSIGYSYAQGQYSYIDETTVAAAAGEEKGFGIEYRQAISSNIEFSLGFQRIKTSGIGIGFADTDGDGDLDTVAGGVDSLNNNVINVGVRYNVSQNFDISLNYAFKKDEVGGNKFGLSVGYSF
jgi:hemolysin activation/secretion protein